MSDLLFELLAAYGVPILACVTFLSCLCVPVPSSLLMLTGGAFTATGDLSLAPVVLGAYGGAVLGDQTGYQVGRRGGAWLDRTVASRPKRQQLFTRARDFTLNRGGPGIFFTCWLFAPLGPYANLAAGASRMSWLTFTLWGLAGEVVWVGLYVGLGFVFADNLALGAQVASQAIGFLAALGLTIFLGVWLARVIRRQK
ncbi:DedA family protein [Vannielia litorea]|uniref:Membrane protein DedA, SNARE-associated domain n=1 Tax=Vannielia litorea TaxID=1217970 RepID=A0A1N6ERH6_9RHOB|nr:DedA family protein [Vannielia litorea]SIN85615.1 membrane protein DedA, SNARE-associated domain [Vannielia litorea]